jgi:hypothetical protein
VEGGDAGRRHHDLVGQQPGHNVLAPAGHPPCLHERSRYVPDHWDTKPENLFNPPEQQPGPAPNGPYDQSNEIQLRDSSGRLRLPAYILIALGIAVTAIAVAIVAVLVGFT